MIAVRTRLAPSPTGTLHLGNARTFLINWLAARRAGGAIVLRIEDIDRARCKREFVDRCLDDLRWLGLTWDEGPIFQSDRLDAYEHAFARLVARGAIYPCVCTRKEIAAAASAPHADDEGPSYPGTCRDRFADAADATRAAGRAPAWRFRVEPGAVEFDDVVLGRIALDPSRSGGDFVVRSFDGTFAYQLAVVVDDGAMGITDVVRGDDLVPSTPRQILLHRALGTTPPRFAHVPLVVGADGRRLSKRHGDADLGRLRAAGVEAGLVLARLARASGIDVEAERVTADELIARFDWSRVPRERVVLGGV